MAHDYGEDERDQIKPSPGSLDGEVPERLTGFPQLFAAQRSIIGLAQQIHNLDDLDHILTRTLAETLMVDGTDYAETQALRAEMKQLLATVRSRRMRAAIRQGKLEDVTRAFQDAVEARLQARES